MQGPAGADALEGLGLQSSEHFCLGFDIHVSDFIQEQRSLGGQFELALVF